eukprot:2219647-Alexandrium_andersonii.AAC.1
MPGIPRMPRRRCADAMPSCLAMIGVTSGPVGGLPAGPTWTCRRSATSTTCRCRCAGRWRTE